MSAVSDGPSIRVADTIFLTPEVEAVLRAMFCNFKQIVVEAEFGRGFSGSRTFRVWLMDAGGKTRLPVAIKIGPAGLIEEEWQAYRLWVEHTLPNIARLESAPVCPQGSQWAGLCYALVGSGVFPVLSLRDYYFEARTEDVCWMLENRLFKILGTAWWLDNRIARTFQMQSDYDILLPVNLLLKPGGEVEADGVQLLEAIRKRRLSTIVPGDRVQLRGFVVAKVDPKKQQLILNLPPALKENLPFSYRLRLEQAPDIERYRVGDVIDSMDGIVSATRHDLLRQEVERALGGGVDLAAPWLPLGSTQTASPELELPNPLLLYHNLLQDFLTVKISTVHGDLNLENILVDPETREVSLIDFATVRQGHALHDLLRLETEVLITLIPATLVEARLPPTAIFLFYEQLHQAILHPNPETSARLSDSAWRKPFELVCTIRKMARRCLFNLDDWGEYYRGLTLYLLGALKFTALDQFSTAPLPKQVAFWGAASAQYFLKAPPANQSRPSKPLGQPASSSKAKTPSLKIEPPLGTMRPDSKLYIERTADEHCWQQLTGPYAATLVVQAPMQMGKSSLIRRMLYQAQKSLRQAVVYIDFQKFTEQYLHDEEKFFTQLCLMIGDALQIPEAVEQYWSGPRTNIIKCSLYLADHLIPKVAGAFILAFDEVERMQTSPFKANFFGMLRTWHNDRAVNEHFARMSLFLSSSTDPYLLIDNPHQSPFNVATSILLEDFTFEEVSELNRRHASALNFAQVKDLMDLLAGHPFLTRLALYQVALGKIDMPALMARATEDSGPFGDHLRHYWRRVLQKPELRKALVHILQHSAYEDDQTFHRLQAAGLIKRAGKQVVFRNNLYERYFKERLNG